MMKKMTGRPKRKVTEMHRCKIESHYPGVVVAAAVVADVVQKMVADVVAFSFVAAVADTLERIEGRLARVAFEIVWFACF